MDHQNSGTASMAAGTLGGTGLVILLQVTQGQLWQTVVLAALGAAVSFLTSILCKKLLGIIKKGRAKRKQPHR